MFQARHHIDGFDVRILTIFRRAHFDAQVTAGTVFRGDLQNVFLSAHVAGFHIQRVQAGRRGFHLFRRNHLGSDGRVRAGRHAVVALRTQLFFPDWDRFGDVAFFPTGGAHWPGTVWRQRRDGQGIAQAGQHRRRYGFHEIRRRVGHHRRTVRAGCIHLLQRYLKQRFARQRQRLPVALDELLAFTAVAFGYRALQLHQRTVARQDVGQMEEGHLHHGVDTCRQATFAGNFGGVNHKEAGFFLVQHRLHFLRQPRPDFINAVRGVNQENTARFQALRHLIFIDKLQLVAADKICLRNKVSRANRVFADAQVGNGQPARFFGVIDEIALGIPRRRIADDFDVVFGC